jgi:hypothetical protein
MPLTSTAIGFEVLVLIRVMETLPIDRAMRAKHSAGSGGGS